MRTSTIAGAAVALAVPAKIWAGAAGIRGVLAGAGVSEGGVARADVGAGNEIAAGTAEAAGGDISAPFEELKSDAAESVAGFFDWAGGRDGRVDVAGCSDGFVICRGFSSEESAPRELPAALDMTGVGNADVVGIAVAGSVSAC